MNILLYDMAGRLVYTKKHIYVSPGDHEFQIPAKEFMGVASAMYILTVQYQKHTGKQRRGDDHRDVFKLVYIR